MIISGFRQTIFITKDGKNRAWVLFDDFNKACCAKLSVFFGDRCICENIEVTDNPTEILLPEVQQKTACKISLFNNKLLVDTLNCKITPVKKWKFAFITSSHEDLGYCAYVDHLGEECAQYLDMAMDMMDQNPDYKYTIEHYWYIKAYENHRDEVKIARLKKYLQAGRFELCTPHSGVHTHWHGYEQLARSTYYSRRTAKNTYGIDPVTALFADISGFSWSVANAYSDAGMKYIVSLPNDFRNSIKGTTDKILPQFFWWEAPNGKNRLLYWSQPHYANSFLYNYLISKGAPLSEAHAKIGENVASSKPLEYEKIWNKYYKGIDGFENEIEGTFEAMLELLGDVSFDLLPVSYYFDHECPNTLLLDIIHAMEKRWSYPKFSMGIPSDCLSYIEEKFGNTLPVLRGDINDQWADFAAIYPEIFAVKRTAEAMLPIAETLSVLNGLEDRLKQYPKQIFDNAMWYMCEFDEHCWATSIKFSDMNKFNMDYIKIRTAKLAYQSIMNTINNAIELPSSDNITVWNIIPQPNNVMLEIPRKIIKDHTISDFICQNLENGNLLTESVPLPSYGFKGFAVSDKPCCNENFTKIENGRFETDFYVVHFDVKSGVIKSIFSKETNSELLDAFAPYALCDYLFVETSKKDSNDRSIAVAVNTNYHIETGPLAIIIHRESYDEKLGASAVSHITFYKTEKNIDLHMEFKNAVGLMGDYRERYLKNIFYSIPLKMDKHKFVWELAGGVVDDKNDRLPHPMDFIVLQNWLAVENELNGIALFSKEMPVFHLGGIHYNNFSNTLSGETSNVYLYALSNRCNDLIFDCAEKCRGEYHLSILPYRGSWKNTVPNWSLKKLYKPVFVNGGDCIEKSYISLDRKNIRLLTLKPSEEKGEGLILRLIETTGCQTRATIRLPFGIAEAEYTNIVEEGISKYAEVNKNTITFETDPFSYTTLKIKTKDTIEWE